MEVLQTEKNDILNSQLIFGVDHMEQKILDLLNSINERLDRFEQRFEQRFDEIDKRFEQMEKRFDEVDKRFAEVFERLDRIESKQEEIIHTLKNFGDRLDITSRKINILNNRQLDNEAKTLNLLERVEKLSSKERNHLW